MAYAAIVSFAQTVDQILNDGRYSISLEQSQQLIAVQGCAILLQEFLEDFPEKGQSLEGRIRDVAYDAEDTIELLMWEQFHSHRGRKDYDFPDLEKISQKLESMAQQVMNIKEEKQLGDSPSASEQVMNIKDEKQLGDSPSASEQVMNITIPQWLCSFPVEHPLFSLKFFNIFCFSQEKSSFTIKDEMQLGDSPSASEQVMNIKDKKQLGDSPSSSRIAPTPMIGLDEDLLVIKGRLCGESSHLQIIPIVGMGGIGKTTLARNAFDDQLIMESFVIRVWVTVSQVYSAQQILEGILLSIQEFNKEKSGKSNGFVEEKVYKTLKGRRYLIVMDDIWSEKAWDDLKRSFPDDNNGSRIMLTSRLSVVAAYPTPCTPLHEIRLMNADQSWDLLRHKLFAHKDCPPELENIGKKIATSCGGLPLAIVVIAGVLSMVGKTPSSWGKIADNVNSSIATKDGHLEKILSLSYNHLPHHLRPCFMYMGGFPEDYEIRVSRLVKLWVAEGFLRHKNGSRSLEEEAEECLGDLVERSLVFVNKRKSDGKIKSCSLHDLLRDLCIRKARQEKFLLHVEKILPKNMENQRRLSLCYIKMDSLAHTYDLTIRSFKGFHCDDIAIRSIGKYKLLRVLVLVYTPSLSELFHLRYLDMNCRSYYPLAISHLENLQTLILHASETPGEIPDPMVELARDIWRMPRLRHLISDFFGTFPTPKEDDLALESLQTLSIVTNFVCTERVMRKIPNLIKLGIFYYGYSSGVEYHLENLVHLAQLEKLKIWIYSGFPSRQKLNPVFPRSLKKLTLSGRRLPWEGLTIVGCLPNLEVVKLRDYACQGSTWETNEGEFPQLKYLLIDKSDLQHWITESSHFPRLKSLLLRRCWCLTEIPNEIGEIDTLELIDVDNTNKSLVESAMRIQEEQQSFGNDGLQVHWLRS